jgi:hypothetical protein
MHNALRISRIRIPRGTLAAMLLLASVFIAFGLATTGVRGNTPAGGYEFQQAPAATPVWLRTVIGQLP